ncbi:myoneurin-like [Episyrphus balteatus]|uniref:myoneurin-like n=1 Tax=Episyrphus balteatus TaxID=286459 RepID=UPI0024857482|nr:myoneurin-like [Episyrphus balteatus]
MNNISQNLDDEGGYCKSITDLTCRVCLNVEELMINIYDEIEDLQSNLVELIHTCGGLVVDRSDYFPKFLCNICAGELLIAAKFREKCAKSNELLIKTLNPSAKSEGECTYIENNSQRFIIIDDENYDTNQIGTLSYPYGSLSDDILNEIIIEDVESKEESEYKMEGNQGTGTLIRNITDLNPLVEENVEEELNHDIFGSCCDTPQENIANQADIVDISGIDETVTLVELVPKKSQKMKKANRIKEIAPLIFDCEECGAVFSNHENLNRHYQRNHPEVKEKLKKCSTCLHSFFRQDSLENHLRTLHGDSTINPNTRLNVKDKGRQETCTICSRTCVSESSLKIHMRSHTGHRPFECPECQKTFKTRVAVKLHLKRHSGHFDWECEVCGKGFVESSNLKVHMRTHTGEKPHLCKRCGKKFSRVFLLQLHLRTHTGEKPYKCSVCAKAYSQKCDLDIHFRSHTGVRPYVCQICFKTYNRSYALQKHKQQHIE